MTKKKVSPGRLAEMRALIARPRTDYIHDECFDGELSEALDHIEALEAELRVTYDQPRNKLRGDIARLEGALAESRVECERLRTELKERPGDIVEGIRRDRLGKE